MRAAIVGHRSWIARHLTDLLTIAKVDVTEVFKSWIGFTDTCNYDCMYVFPGRANPTDREMALEEEFVDRLTLLPRAWVPRRIVFLSSQAVYLDTPYGAHKRKMENILLEAQSLRGSPMISNLVIIRPGAVFGPWQDPKSPMLIPSLARESGMLDLRTPDRPTQFVSVYDLVKHLADHVDPTHVDKLRQGYYNSSYPVPGTFMMTSGQMKELYLTFRYLNEGTPGTGA